MIEWMDTHSPEMGVPSMLDRKRRGQMDLFVAGSLERLIPEDHVLKRVDRVLDLSWLRAEVAECYCADNGRPGLDPEVVVRLMLAGMLLGYVHDRRLLREAQVNIAIRWFIGCGLHEDLPDHSSLTRIRQRWGEERFKEIFRRTVRACLDAKVAKGEVIHVDASLIRADVSWESLAERHADEVVRENDSEDESGKKGGGGSVSRTDPDARLARKSGRVGFEPSYKHHAVVDDERGVVLDVAVTEGTVNEREMLEPHLEAVCALSGREPALVTADSGYAYSKVYGALERRGVEALIPAKKEPAQSRVPLRLFRYDERRRVVKCPGGRTLRPRGSTERGRCYVSRTRDCAGCALRRDCLSKSQTSKTVLIPHEYPALLRARRRHARWGAGERRLWRRHMWRSEGYHGEAKSWHGLGRAVRRGLANMRIQAYLTAAAVNLKRLAAALAARLFALWRACAARRRRLRAYRAPIGLPLRRRMSRHITRFRNGVFQQPLVRGVRKSKTPPPGWSAPPFYAPRPGEGRCPFIPP